MGPEKVDRNYTFLYSYGNLKCKRNFFLLLEVKDIVGHYWIITKAFFGSNNETREKKKTIKWKMNLFYMVRMSPHQIKQPNICYFVHTHMRIYYSS